MTGALLRRLVVLDAQSLMHENWRRINIDGIEQTALEERISTSEDLLCVAILQRNTEHLKDISGLHLLGEAINVGVNGGVVRDDPLTNPLKGSAHGTVHFHGRSFDAVVVGEVLGNLVVGGCLSNET